MAKCKGATCTRSKQTKITKTFIHPGKQLLCQFTPNLLTIVADLSEAQILSDTIRAEIMNPIEELVIHISKVKHKTIFKEQTIKATEIMEEELRFLANGIQIYQTMVFKDGNRARENFNVSLTQRITIVVSEIME